jgi:hypothetical protein
VQGRRIGARAFSGKEKALGRKVAREEGSERVAREVVVA